MTNITLEKWYYFEIDSIILECVLNINEENLIDDADTFTDVIIDTCKEVENCYSISKESVIDLFERLYEEQKYKNPEHAQRWKNRAIYNLKEIDGDWIIVKESDKPVEEPKIGESKKSDIKDFLEKSKYDIHQEICDKLHQTYVQKNQAYGDSFAESVKKFGLVAAATRMEDKHNRITNLIQNPDVDKGDESLKDSLLDLANYCIMTAMILDERAES